MNRHRRKIANVLRALAESVEAGGTEDESINVELKQQSSMFERRDVCRAEVSVTITDGGATMARVATAAMPAPRRRRRKR